MKPKTQKNFYISLWFLSAFLIWTAAVCLIDVQPIGPQGSSVGFATVNYSFHNLTGVHLSLYTITDWLSLIPLGFAAGFACMGLAQWIYRKHLLKVDRSILILGGFYLIVMAAYLFFETFAVNYRPVLINGFLEASYPSSTTLLVLCIMPTTMLQFHTRIRNKRFKRCVMLGMAAYTAFMVIGRLFSGVHWLTDIIGSVLLSTGLVMTYVSLCRRNQDKPPFMK